MAQNIIPYTSDVSDITNIPDARATGDDFGAQIGQSLSQIGQSTIQLSDALKEHQNRTDGVDGELALAQARQDMTQHLIQQENSPAAGSPTFTSDFGQAFDDYQAKAADNLPNNNKVRQAFQVGMANLRSELSIRAMQSQASQGAAITTQKAQQTLSTYVNTIQTDPTQYDASVAAGNKMIDGLGLPPEQSDKLRNTFTNTSIAARFDAMFRAAKTPAAINGVVNDLENGPWKDKMDVQQYQDMLRVAKSAQGSVQKMANETAEAGVNGIEDRIKGGANIDPSEMAQVGAAVKQSNNPVLLDKWARLQVQNDTTQRVNSLSSPSLTGYIQANKTGMADQTGPNTTTGRAVDGFNYLKSKYGLDDVAALGPMANIGRETGFMPRPGDGGTSDGYFQWHADRMTRAAAAGATGPDIRRAIDYAMSEPEGQAWLAQAKAGAFKSPEDAAQAWMSLFEKPKDPTADAPINNRWVQRLTEVVNGGKPLAQGPEGAPEGATPGLAQGGATSPTEYEWIRAQAAEQVLKRRDAQVAAGNQMQAGADAGLYTLSPLQSAQDFLARGQQSQVAQGFLDTKENKPFTPQEVAAFDQVMQSGNIDQKINLLKNVSSMGATASDAFKQIGEKNPVFAHIGGLATISPAIAEDVLRGQQAMQDNPDAKSMLTAKNTGPGPGGTAAFFDGIAGQALSAMPKDAYAARQAADALYVQRVGAGAPWNADAYTQAVRDVMGSKPGDSAGGVTTINGQPTVMPPGVSGDDFQTMLHSLQPNDLLTHSAGGGPPMDSKGRDISVADIQAEGRFRAISAGIYHVYMADGAPAGGTGPGGLYTFQIDAKGVQDILARPQQPGMASSLWSTITNPSFWYHPSGGYGLPDTSAYKNEPSMQQQEDQITNTPPAAPIDLGRGSHVR
jgi:predicted transcriptional regulator